MTLLHDIQTLYHDARDVPARDPAWDALRAAEAADLPTCINHPGRTTAGRFDDEPHGYCHECVAAELIRRRLWLVSFGVVQGGYEALR